MCGEFGKYSDDGYDDSTPLPNRTVRARKHYTCEPCGGTIGAGSYHVVVPWISDGQAVQVRAHLQCRDVMEQIEVYGRGVVREAFLEDEDRGELALEHHRQIAEWASGAPRWTKGEIDAAKARAAEMAWMLDDEPEREGGAR